jgi:hypothetical protein
LTEPQKPSRAKVPAKEEALKRTRVWRESVTRETAGMKMPDGSVFAGRLPNGKKVYTLPQNESVAMDFNAAAACAARRNNSKSLGHDDWRLPSQEELDLLYRNRDKGVLKGSFEFSATVEQQTDGDYWSSTRSQSSLPLVHVQNLENGSKGQSHVRCRGIVRLVR